MLFIKRLQDLQKSVKSKGITSIFYPSIRFENTKVPSIMNAIEETSIFIGTSNPKEYPELFNMDYSGDLSFLSTEGPEIYSKIMDKIFNNKFCSENNYLL